MSVLGQNDESKKREKASWEFPAHYLDLTCEPVYPSPLAREGICSEFEVPVQLLQYCDSMMRALLGKGPGGEKEKGEKR